MSLMEATREEVILQNQVNNSTRPRGSGFFKDWLARCKSQEKYHQSWYPGAFTEPERIVSFAYLRQVNDTNGRFQVNRDTDVQFQQIFKSDHYNFCHL